MVKYLFNLGDYTFKFACDDTALIYMSLVPNSTL